MQHSQAFADTVIAGTLFETAVGGKKNNQESAYES